MGKFRGVKRLEALSSPSDPVAMQSHPGLRAHYRDRDFPADSSIEFLRARVRFAPPQRLGAVGLQDVGDVDLRTVVLEKPVSGLGLVGGHEGFEFCPVPLTQRRALPNAEVHGAQAAFLHKMAKGNP